MKKWVLLGIVLMVVIAAGIGCLQSKERKEATKECKDEPNEEARKECIKELEEAFEEYGIG